MTLRIEGNLHGWIDRNFLPGDYCKRSMDEMDCSHQLPALCLTVMGTLAGDVFRDETISDQVKLRKLLLVGVGCVVLGFTMGITFPINKTFVEQFHLIMLTGGMAFLSLGLFYWVIDILKYQKLDVLLYCELA
jgi:predicted acyltransferase